MSPIQTAHFSKDGNAPEIMAYPDSSRPHYFQIFGFGQKYRDMLAFAGVEWKDTYLGFFRPLGNRHIRIRSCEYEETLIKASHPSVFTLMRSFAFSVSLNQPEALIKCNEIFKQNTLANWIATHEKHLVDNGSNGHYLGDKASRVLEFGSSSFV
ncbi:hypothetical protein BGW38_001471 [Lunasporangiospora selenospora]|uniref:Uncharacterized protein n=1 Tax=Lunasporangiospora selenospora TaxID=979761 RepID=A0A9P6FTX0_9FUNG|nr:hypothetical protein BGW38_001471 [Lunasporangiospora selenospora]